MLNARSTRAQVGASQPGLARPGGDFLVTEPAATEKLLAVERFPGVVWEPACGDGTMAEVLRTGAGVTQVLASDLHDRGYGEPNVDFLTFVPAALPDHVVTNPPYDRAEAFVRRALDHDVTKVALLLRLLYLEGIGRRERLWSRRPPARVHVFSDRPRFQRNGEGPFRKGLIGFAWFVWDREHAGPPTIGWI